MLVPCALTLNVLKASRQDLADVLRASRADPSISSTRQSYKAATTGEDEPEAEPEALPADAAQRHGWKPRQPKKERAPMEPTMQGAILIQAMFSLDAPAVETIINR